jgi:hypothetical protein
MPKSRLLLAGLLSMAVAVPDASAQVRDVLLVSSFSTGEVVALDAATGVKAAAPFVPAGSGGLIAPTSLIFGPDGNLYVASSARAGAVMRYDGTTGAFLGVLVAAGSGGLAFPEALLFGPDGNLYIANNDPSGGHSVKRYNGVTGAFIDTFAVGGGITTPLGMAFGPDGNLYVVSATTNSVLRYNGKTGTFIDAFVTAGSGGLNSPWGLVFATDGRLYVSSTGNDSVLRYDGKTGAFIDVFVTTGAGGLSMPTDLTFTPDGRLLVAMGVGTASRILRYSATGAFLDAFATDTSVSFPTFMTFSPDRQCPQSTADTDGDGLLDCWERDGIDANGDGVIDLQLYDLDGDGTIGAAERGDPFHKDVFVEVDWMESHQPDANALATVTTAFANAPVVNPDHTTGIRLHIQINEQAVAHNAVMTFLPRCGTAAGPVDFDAIKTASFGTAAERASGNVAAVREAKRRAFRYSLFAHQLAGGCSTNSGLAELPGNDFVVAIAGWTGYETNGNADQQAGTFMHELGHNFGLTHGGLFDDAVNKVSFNCKPNYLSVMNYTYQYDDLWVTGRPLDYSRAALPALNEVAIFGTPGTGLQEADGIGCAVPGACPANPRVSFGPPKATGGLPSLAKNQDASGAIDWDLSGFAGDTSVARDINRLGFPACNGFGALLKGFDDWSSLQYNFRLTTDYADGLHGTSGDELDVDEVLPVSPDFDEDGVPNVRDNCPLIPNADQLDRNNNHTGDACDDITAPLVTFSRTPAANANGWNNAAVSVTFTCSDPNVPPLVSGLKSIGVTGAASAESATSPLAVAIAGEGAGQQVTATCTDNAGNAASAAVADISIDSTAPVVTVTGVTQGATYVLGAVPVAACSTADALSGVATPASLSLTGGTGGGVGTFTASCGGAQDRAGNPGATVAVTYSVQYAFTGFLAPLGSQAYAGLFKLGRTIPVKWTLASAGGAPVSDLGAVRSLQIAANSVCAGDADGTPVDPGSSSAAGLRYDTASSQFIFNWNTSGLTAGCYTIVLTLDDGTSHATKLRLR